MGSVKVAVKSDIPEGTGKPVEAEGKALAVFNVGGTFYATDNTCLHMGGPLGEGALSGNTVTCPWHGWQYDVTTGKNAEQNVEVKTYKVEVKGEDIFVEV